MHEEVITTNVKELSSIAKALTKKGEFVVMVGPM
jgi:16S rRNA C1402 (ribose-2'-O) methylase RsmI